MTYVVTPTGIFAQESEVTGDGSSDNDVDNKQSESVRASDINVPLFTSNFLRNNDAKNNKNLLTHENNNVSMQSTVSQSL